MSRANERVYLLHAQHYLKRFLRLIDDYRVGRGRIGELSEKMTAVLPQVSAAYFWCTRTSAYDSEASSMRQQFVDREPTPPAIDARNAAESRHWADTIKSQIDGLTDDPNTFAFLGQFAAMAKTEAEILKVRGDTRESLAELLASVKVCRVTETEDSDLIDLMSSLDRGVTSIKDE